MAEANEPKQNVSKDQVVKAVHNEAGLERIKEVLLGDEMEDVGRRLAEVDVKIQQAFAVMQDSLHKRIETLETFVKREISSLGERLKGEKTERKAADGEISAVVERIEAEQGSIRRELLEESKKIVEDYMNQLKSLAQSTERSFQGVHRNKLDRALLARTLDRIVQELGREEGQRPSLGKTA